MKNLKNAIPAVNKYQGSCLKKTLIYEGRKYLIKKKDPIRHRNKFSTSYSASIYSEDIGCKIYKALDIDVQNTFLCKCLENGQEISCCACEDFNDPPYRLNEFKNIYVSEIPSSSNSVTNAYPSIEDIQRIYRTAEPLKNHLEFEQRFWDMILVDTLINNRDRNLDNWGFLMHDQNDSLIKLAPVYDCGSSFSAHLSEHSVAECLKDPYLMSIKELNINFPFLLNNKRVLAFDLFKNPTEGLKDSVLRIVPKIKDQADYICKIVENEEELSPERKDFIIASMKLRYTKILEPCLKRLHKQTDENLNSRTIK